MDNENTLAALHWYAINTRLREEVRADKNLTAWGIETFAPKIKQRRNNPYTGSPSYISQSLFPRYLFARFDAGRMLHKIYYTRGVQSVVSFNCNPLQVEDEIIHLIQSRVDSKGFVQLDEEFKPGEEVIVNEGSLRGISGIFNRATKDASRVEILLNAINYQATVIVEREMVQKAVQAIL
jgi:transcriptional antiterminator RfaH